MSERIQFKLGDLFGPAAECGYLSEDEIVDWLEGRLALDRRERWLSHARTCTTCDELVSNYEAFQKLSTDGLSIPSEARAYAERDGEMRRALGLGSQKVRRWSPFKWFVPAVTLAVLLLVMFWPSAPRLIEDVERFPLVPPPAIRGYSLGEHWEGIESAWAVNDYAAAESRLEEARAEHPEMADLAFYLGLSRLYTEDWAGAVEALRDADRLQADSPSEATRWALATALDRAGRSSAACEVLRTIDALGGSRGARAGRIVESRCD